MIAPGLCQPALGCGLYQPDQLLHRSMIALRAQPGYHGGCDARDQRVMIHLLALMDVRDMELDQRAGKHLERIHDRHRIEGEGGRVNDDPRTIVRRLVNPVDQL